MDRTLHIVHVLIGNTENPHIFTKTHTCLIKRLVKKNSKHVKIEEMVYIVLENILTSVTYSILSSNQKVHYM